MKISEKLVEMLRDGGMKLPDDCIAVRVMCGRCQAAVGGWKWTLKSEENSTVGNFGGSYTMSDIVASGGYLRDDVGEIFPEE